MPCLLAYMCKLPARFSFFKTSWAPDLSASGQQFFDGGRHRFSARVCREGVCTRAAFARMK